MLSLAFHFGTTYFTDSLSVPIWNKYISFDGAKPLFAKRFVRPRRCKRSPKMVGTEGKSGRKALANIRYCPKMKR